MTDSYVQVQGSFLAAAAIIQFALPTFRKKSVGRERKDIYVQLDATDKAGNLTVRQRIQKTLADMEVRSPGTKAFAITSTEAISSSLVGEDGIDWGCRKVYFELQKGGGAKAWIFVWGKSGELHLTPGDDTKIIYGPSLKPAPTAVRIVF